MPALQPLTPITTLPTASRSASGSPLPGRLKPMPKSSPNSPPPERRQRDNDPLPPGARARRGSAPAVPAPIMIALSGWPDAVYISSSNNPKKRGRSGTATPPEVYDGVGGPRILPQHISPSRGKTPVGAPSRRGAPPSARPVIPGRPFPALSADAAGARLPKTRTILPKPPAPPTPPPPAPQHSIFATTCPHLADPSLGPCPFPTHPHDIRGMFPPTSHLEKLYGKKVAVEPTVGKNGAKRPVAQPLPVTIVKGKGKGKEVPISSSVSSDKGKTPTSRPALSHPTPYRHSSDPRYLPSSAFLHKGRALPLVPSWSGASSASSSRVGTPGVDSSVKQAEGERQGGGDVEMQDPKLPTKRHLSPSPSSSSSHSSSSMLEDAHPNKVRLLSPSAPSTSTSSSSSSSPSTTPVLSVTPKSTLDSAQEAGLLWKRVIVNYPELMDVDVDVDVGDHHTEAVVEEEGMGMEVDTEVGVGRVIA
ncbi:hypothetical protein L198_05870 [Cryptococcus wingfieldii CBS 7118]|uniref:Uncharacterized protein n=1 Tax=Cryptococcus wingfieldii CBS 7118 TaxID=1295528 RepID=A0A1E3IS02_9TREE|nr:hypothetical protein L198_05870 [Cryptococcus wingfieldii CBS 7118]ODN91359.1 hypothetical protein L198_05870 [Cryptococcus wingfieldii CBS 7118]